MLRIVVIAVAMVTTLPGTLAQPDQQPVDWYRLIDSLLEDRASSYFTFTTALHPVRYDSTVMSYLGDVARRDSHAVGESFSLNRLGTIHRRRSRMDSALKCHDRARQLTEQSRDTLGQVVSLNSRGIVFRHGNRVSEGIDAHQAAIGLAVAARPNREISRAIAIAHDSRGRLHMTLEQYDLAEQEFLKSMAIEREIGSTRGLAINHYNLGNVHERRGKLDKALAQYRTALTLNEQINSTLGRGINNIGMARVLTRQGSYGMALRYAREALPIVEEHKDDYYTTTAELAYADVLIETNNLSSARPHLDRALQIANSRGYIDEQGQTYLLLSKLEERQGNTAEAFTYYRLAKELDEQVLTEKNQRYVSTLSAQYDSELKEAEIARLAQENELVRERARRTQRNFLMLVVLLVLVALILFILYRQRKLVLQRDLVRLEQQRLASQMNPHFLFNALNSVKSYLILNQGDTAIAYLSKFARLMRRILSSTIDEEVPLLEEIENSRLYVAVENARFDGEIDFRVHVDPRVDTDFITVPPLMLQPFLENALWHGLRMKQGQKILELEARVDDADQLTLLVRDNGIGRAAAKGETTEHAYQRRSVGLDITRQRLKHFAKKRGRFADFEVHDLVTPDGEAGGTEVVITLI